MEDRYLAYVWAAMEKAVLIVLLGTIVSLEARSQDWRARAEERIETHRKGDLVVEVHDANGNPLSGAAVRIEMQRHAFKFGTAVDAEWARSKPRDDFSSGDLDLGEKLSAFRVQLDAPAGAPITSAVLQLTADEPGQDEPAILTVWAAALDDAGPLEQSAIETLPRTTQSVVWNVAPWLQEGEQGAAQRSPDVSVLVREVIDRDGWQPGQHIVFILDGSGKRSARTYDQDPGAAPRLIYDAGQERTTVVARSEDDAEASSANFYREDAQRYRAELAQLFNYATLENALKWRPWELDPGMADGALAWLNEQGIPVRGHTMIWSSWRWNAIPADVEARQQEGDFVRRRAADHVQRIATAYAGRIPEWDVINEPLHETDLEAIVGFDERLEWFRLARAADPDARLFVNDFDILEGPAQVDRYKQLVRDLIEKGADIGGVGMQGHVLGQAPTPEQLVDRLASLAELGLPLQITEFDMNKNWSEAQQANFMEDMLIASFAEPAVTAFIMWGFWDGKHWLGNAPLFNDDWTLKMSGAVWKDLVFDEWWTQKERIADADGLASFHGFKGEYVVTASYGEFSDTLHVSLNDRHVVDWTLPVAAVAKEDVHPRTEHDAEPAVALFPNPLTPESRLVVSLERASDVGIEWVDLLGRVLTSRQRTALPAGKHRFPIPASAMPAGFYVARVTITERGRPFVHALPVTYVK